MFTILVAEDDPNLRELFCVVLENSRYNTIAASNGLEALEMLERSTVNLLITDVMMPELDGIELAGHARRLYPDMPILMITVRGTLADKRDGFRAGVDDYMVKPVDVNEMVWRVEALLRRARINCERRVEIGATVLDRDALTVAVGDTVHELPNKEFFLLFKLLSNPNRIFTRRQIMDDVWGIDSSADAHTLDVHVSRLRERFRNDEDFEIVTVRGLGYKAVVTHG